MEAHHQECSVPPGFRFHPTEEELVGYYLARKVMQQQQASSNHHHMTDDDDLHIIQEVDLYRIEPWDLQERCKQQQDDGQAAEWYLFSYKDRKYPSGTRSNRATAAGFWKATRRDKPVLSRSSRLIIGMRKKLVFYKGRAPNGRKTHWIMHECRLLQEQAAAAGCWVVCRAFHKPTIPRLVESPPTAIAARAAADHHLVPMTIQQHQQGGNNTATNHEVAAAAIDWNFLDTLALFAFVA